MAKKKSDTIRFIAIYDDGNTAPFEVDTFTLRGGDYIARVIAGEMQRGGQLRAGQIVRIERAPN
jgi:hypothetical protein